MEICVFICYLFFKDDIYWIRKLCCTAEDKDGGNEDCGVGKWTSLV